MSDAAIINGEKCTDNSLIGRNGVGKSTLLRHIALREVAIPMHISVL